MDEEKASTAFISSQAPKLVLITGLVFLPHPLPHLRQISFHRSGDNGQKAF